MRFIYVLLACCLFIAGPAGAQIYFGGEVGVNCATYTGKLGGNNRSIKFAETFGAVFSKDISWHLSLQGGVYYARNGYSVLYHGLTYRVGVNTIEVPLSLECQIGRPKARNYFIGGGPYGGMNINGKTSLTGGAFPTNQDLKVGGGRNDDIKRYDAGFGIWFAAQVSKGLFFRLRCQSSFFSLDPKDAKGDNPMRNQAVRLTVGYMFE